MTQKVQPTVSARYHLSDQDFASLAALAHKNYGLSLPPSKKALLYSRLSKRVRALGLVDFSDYCEVLKNDQGETLHFLSALTTNVTHFFREAHHFEILQRDTVPHLQRKAQRGAPVRIWSAGCSSGQEPYSIAMTLLEADPTLAKADLRILATDIDPKILEIAEQATYDKDLLSPDAPVDWRPYVEERPAARIKMAKTLRSMVTFSQLNLISDWALPPDLDVIVCRNVAIYFDAETKSRLWHRFSQALRPGGYLFIGHSERLDAQSAKAFEPIGITAFRRIGTQDLPARTKGGRF